MLKRSLKKMIRRATRKDAVGIAVVHVTAWREAYAGIVPRAYLESLSIVNRADMWDGLLGNPSSRIWVSLNDYIVNGFIAGGGCRDDDLPDCDEVYAIYVSPGSQRQGLGQSLMEAFLFERAETCTLWVLEGNENAISFYSSMGFEADGRTKIVELGGEELSESRYRRIANKTQHHKPDRVGGSEA